MIRPETIQQASPWRRSAEYFGELVHDCAWLLGFGMLSLTASATRGRAIRNVIRQLSRPTEIMW